MNQLYFRSKASVEQAGPGDGTYLLTATGFSLGLADFMLAGLLGESILEADFLLAGVRREMLLRKMQHFSSQLSGVMLITCPIIRSSRSLRSRRSAQLSGALQGNTKFFFLVSINS